MSSAILSTPTLLSQLIFTSSKSVNLFAIFERVASLNTPLIIVSDSKSLLVSKIGRSVLFSDREWIPDNVEVVIRKINEDLDRIHKW